MANGTFGGGTGISTDPYLVEDALDLVAVKNNLTAYYKQTADINISSYTNWNPIGNGMTEATFSGEYNGNNFSVYNLTIDASDDGYWGLFGLLNENGKISKLKVINIDITVTNSLNVGGLVGLSSVNSIIEYCFTSGNISSTGDYVGGIIGLSNSDITYSSSTCYITGNDYVGGFVGLATGDISNSYATGKVVGHEYVGGFVGLVSDTFTMLNCFSIGEIIASDYSGGFCGLNAGIVTNSYYDYQTSGQSDEDDKGEPKTTVQMQTQSTYSGWDFVNTWGIKTNYNADYPYLLQQFVLMDKMDKPIKNAVQSPKSVQASKATLYNSEGTKTIEYVFLSNGMIIAEK